MQVLCISVVLLAAATITLGMKAQYWGTNAEREAIVNEALSEAKLSATLREQATQASMDNNKPITASMKLARGFKKASPRIQKIGKARLFMEDAVKRAERKLFELKKTTNAQSMSAEAQAEEIASELFHRPGDFLNEEEIAKIYTESGCLLERSEVDTTCISPARIEYRTIDGTCNNVFNATLGSSGTEFRRLIPGQYENGIESPFGTLQFLSDPGEEGEFSQLFRVGPFRPPHPSPRLASQVIIRDRDDDELPFTHILMQWGQFLDHDLDLAPELEAECEGCDLTEICHNIRVPRNDYQFGVGTNRDGDCLPFRRSIPSCMTDLPGSFSPREHINALTSFIDGSMVYGSDVTTLSVVREFDRGLLRTGEPVELGQGRTLPRLGVLEEEGIPNVEEVVACPTASGTDCFVCGDIRCNEQLSLTIMHTIWVREHNRLAAELERINPHWSDEKLFLEARAIVGAEIQKITYIDYLPLVLGREVFDQVIGEYLGYDLDVDPSVPNSFATAAYRYGHSLIRPEFVRLDEFYNPLDIGALPLNEAFFNPGGFEESGGTDPILRGLVTVNSRRVDEFLSSQLTNQLFENVSIPGSGMDLAGLNIQRSRDHGLPPYAIFKRFCQTEFPELEFTDIENQLTFIRLLQVYGSIESVELWVGGLAEERLNGSLLGSTFACLFGLTFRNVRDGDRFYFENPESNFRASQIDEINRVTLSSVLCANGDNIRDIQLNAFLSNQPRIPCDSIPTISLGAWRENPCYARLDLIGTNGLVDAVSTKLDLFVPERFRNLDDQLCLPFVCPTATIPSGLAVFPTDFPDPCFVQENALLPPRLPPFPPGSPPFQLYVGIISLANIAPESGLHSSLKSCLSSSIAAFTFSDCVPPTPSAQGKEGCYESPDCKTDDPKELPKALKGLHNKSNLATSLGKNNAAQEGIVEDNFVELQQQLLHELENDLEQLNQQETGRVPSHFD